jgi:hypothetical protein
MANSLGYASRLVLMSLLLAGPGSLPAVAQSRRTSQTRWMACRSYGRFARCSGGLLETIPIPSRTK